MKRFRITSINTYYRWTNEIKFVDAETEEEARELLYNDYIEAEREDLIEDDLIDTRIEEIVEVE